MNKPFLTLFLVLALAGFCLAQAPATEATLFQKPTVNQTHIVFVYAGDLWSVPRAGGDAKRLTTGVGTETDPFFSPDGTQIAFTGEYDGNTDVYAMPAAGGVPKRLTYHPGADVVAGWTPDGKRILFSSSRNSYAGFVRLFTVGLDANSGSLPEEVPLPSGERGAFSADGSMIAYEPLNQWQPEWKRYHGGQQDVIWIAKLSDSSIEKLPRKGGNDRYPMWVGDRIYFLSDRDERYALYSYDVKTKRVDLLVKDSVFDIKSASAWSGDAKSSAVIAYEQFGTIHLYDLKTNKAQKVNIRVAADQLAMRPRFEKVGTRIFNSHISPTGARAVFEARGEIITVPAEKGDPRNLTNTPGVMERDPAWSPDGKWIAYFSEESGEYALHLRDQKGEGEVKKIALPPTFYRSPVWSPDSKKIALADKKLQLWYLEIEKGQPVKVDHNPIGFNDDVMEPVWSPDSRWITYTKQLPNLLRAVFVYSLETGATHQLTEALGDARYPVFDRSGKYLYFTASTNLGPSISFADLSGIANQPTRSVYAIVLRNDIPSPLAPESDEEKVAEEKKPEGTTPADKPADKLEEKKADAAPAAGAAKPPAKKDEPTRIDLEGIDQRIIALPIPNRNYLGLIAGKANLIYVLEQPAGATTPGVTVQKYDLEKRKLDKAMDGVTSFEVSANGEKVLYRQGFGSWVIGSVATLGAPTPPGAPGGPNVLKVADMEVRVEPQIEWRQMYNEVWRNERDFFYDKNLHGLNLEEMRKRYAPYVEAVAHRSDLTYLFTEMLNQLTVGHMFIGGGDQQRPNFVPGGLLGADYKVENGRYRFEKIYNGENWNPSLRAPLTQPGVNVKEGDYLLAVNGRELRSTDSVYGFFESKAGKQVVIKVGANPDGTDSRGATVVPVASEQGLRYLAWIEGNRRKVDQMSGGKLAYLHMPDTANGGYTSFNRYFFAQTNKHGVLLDERFNNGGLLADYVVQLLGRQQLSNIHYREGNQDVPVPAGAIYGPKAMLINEMAGSGGDAMPWYFKKSKLGPLVGKRTWGGLIAAFGAPPLMDGGGHTAPDAAIYGLDGEWEVENAGVAPDIEVEFDPAAWRQGRDPQLERAVEYLLDELKKNPPKQYKLPAFPNYHKNATPAPAGQGGRGN